jgi:signal transduction histidine kinase
VSELITSPYAVVMDRREQALDGAAVLGTVAVGLALLLSRIGAGRAGLPVAADLPVGAVSCTAIWFRRRWPAGVGVVTAVTSAISLSSGAAALWAVANAGSRCRTGAAIAIAALHQLAMIGYYQIWRPVEPFWEFWLISMSEYTAVLALGMYLRARRELVISLRERVAEAVTAQQVMADQARLAERTRIAAEMHDVLAHRVSLVALHAGALEIQPDLPPRAVRETAGLIRSTARQALTELRDVMGVLRDPASSDAAPHVPQPTLASITGLVGEFATAGLIVTLDMDVPGAEVAPGPLGRDAYRIVREGLTNVTKHAAGTVARVSLAGRPDTGLLVTVRNKLPLAYQPPALPGASAGLAGLAERVTLAGGTLTHGPDGAGDFVLTAELRWEKGE